MKRLLVSLAFLAAVTGAAVAAPAPTPTPNAAVMARAKDWFHRIATGNIDRSQLTSQMNAALTDAMIKQIHTQVEPLGDPVGFQEVRSGRKNGFDYSLYAVTFATGETWDYLFVYDRTSNKISGLQIAPAP